ncbi:MAG TPA: DsbE family thiol:disulfide interchange protein [Rhodobacteraceae bacterium]|jgi:cytochrome c biogenesis protein CcmG, thiol:disulfide interchange protein DsbE|nr:DsbE family thiol:disulfide interchange protein [Pseudomonadota bacterium]MDA1285293.1 DsbE family thiol:disulfide interchange protein [Pseudomonadota bacterium]NQW14848.1 DsbE family thiol:disulfide interchange protein [Rhodobacter sp.]HBN29791.1 DsbE family thiol:disulfide interchange protein [Paracoccaceae bacterium]
MPKISIAMLVPVVAIGVILMFTFGLGRDDPNALPSTLEGRLAPALVTTVLGDLPLIQDKDLRADGVKLVNYWASWCQPCRAEHPNLMALKDMGIPIYGVNYKDESPKGLKFLSDLGNPYTAVGQDAAGRQAIDWGVYGVPETFVIDGKGKILLRFPGPITSRVLQETILPLIAKANGS